MSEWYGALRVAGLDISLTSTGMSDGRTHWVTQTSADDELEFRMDRIVTRARSFAEGAGDWHADASLVVIEAGAFSRGAQSAAAEYLSALRFMVRRELWKLGIPFAMVPPTTLKAYTAGNGKADKPRMVEAVRDRHGIDFSSVRVKDGRYDLTDAVALAAMGYARVGQPLPTVGLPAPQVSMNAVRWPQLISD